MTVRRYAYDDSHYYPYGEEITGTANDTYKYAQTYRDSDSGLDYAVNRYYNAGIGRFLTPDPYSATATAPTDPNTPQSWNRYPYVGNDPVNYKDPSGLLQLTLDCTGNGEGQWTCIELTGDTNVNSTSSTDPSPKRPVDAGTDKQARGQLGKRLKNFSGSNCDKVFGKVIGDYSTKGFTDSVNSTEFYASKGSLGNLTQDDVSGNGDNTKLRNSVPFGDDAVTVNGPQGSAVLLGPNYFSNTNDTFQQNTLMHELLHADTGWNDSDIFNNFKNNGLTQYNPGTGDISDWLSNDCKKTDKTSIFN